MKCGCRIDVFPGEALEARMAIVFCPLHEAAAKMLAALEIFMQANAHGGYEFEINEKVVYSQMHKSIMEAKK